MVIRKYARQSFSAVAVIHFVSDHFSTYRNRYCKCMRDFTYVNMQCLNNSPVSDGSPYTVTDKTHIPKTFLHHPCFKEYNTGIL